MRGDRFRDSKRQVLELSEAIACLDINRIRQNSFSRRRLEDLQEKVKTGLEKANILITSGGVSMGESDLMKHALNNLKAEVHFGRVFMKPGSALFLSPERSSNKGSLSHQIQNRKPTTFASLISESNERKLIFCLPGNPVSSTVCFYLFVLPAVRKMSGHPYPDLPIVKAKVSPCLHDGLPSLPFPSQDLIGPEFSLANLSSWIHVQSIKELSFSLTTVVLRRTSLLWELEGRLAADYWAWEPPMLSWSFLLLQKLKLWKRVKQWKQFWLACYESSLERIKFKRKREKPKRGANELRK